MFFCFFTKNLTLSLPVIRCAGHITDLASNNNISKTAEVNTAFTINFVERVFDKLSYGIQVDRRRTCGSLVINV